MAAEEKLPEVTETTAVTEPATQPSTATKKKKPKKRKRTPKPHILTQFTLRSPPWSYIHLQHLTSHGPPATTTTPSSLDALTAHLQLTAALTQFLGLHGAAIPLDILQLRTESAELWIRVPAQDRSALLAAVGGCVSGKGEGWRVVGSSAWDARAMAMGSGQGLFED
ncbi:hypothetical protein B0A55_10330 [Friedmanniomyces simplex]|uniref:Ribonucleases P/MRP subunit Pop8-like domain-containing protein n=1 Tax=Friedmanniomyces simplex TaxID=329884 RepID=A0A4U0WUR4_9PEZI|nr:hypothetical protein B0A55_10330 [Friedmanniomyces simplex]